MNFQATGWHRLLAILLLGIFILIAFFPFFPSSAAEEATGVPGYSDAFEDLKQDKRFDPDKYPALPNSDKQYYSLKVITVGESIDGEVFVYVYQPSGSMENIHAVSINISTAERTAKDFKNYKLTYLNNNGVYFKYRVEGLAVSSAEIRHYEISNILRPWNASYGDPIPGGDNTISEQPYPVGKMFTFKTLSNGASVLSVEDVEYITVTKKFVGYIRYKESGPLYLINYFGEYGLDAHFVAFSTDRKIEELLEADVYFKRREYRYEYRGAFDVSYKGWQTEEAVEDYAYLVYGENPGIWTSEGLFTRSEHMFQRILKTTDFVKQDFDLGLFEFPGFNVEDEGDIEFTETAAKELAGTTWVLNFTETEYAEYYGSYEGVPSGVHRYTRVGDVSILRLKFKTGGEIYDLGVVDNKQTGSLDPAGTVEEEPWWQKMMMLLLLILFFVIFWPIVSPVLMLLFRFLGLGIKLLAKPFLWLLSLPFKILGLIFRRRR